MTIKELLEMEIHDERVLDHKVPHFKQKKLPHNGKIQLKLKGGYHEY